MDLNLSISNDIIVTKNDIGMTFAWYCKFFNISMLVWLCLSCCFLWSVYSRLSLSQILRDSLKNFEISILRHIRFFRIQEKLIRLTTFNKYMCNLTLEVRDILKILLKQFLLFSTIFFYMLLDFHVGTRFSLRDKRLFEISEVEIAGVNCISQ